MRGYQYKSEGPGEPRKNPIAYESPNDGQEKLAETASLRNDASAQELQDRGFAEREV